MTVPDRSPNLAAWVRRPGPVAASFAAVGAACLLISLLVGGGLLGFALAGIGAVCIVAGTMTAFILLLGRLLGLDSRSERVVREGRHRILFPGAQGHIHISSRAFRNPPANSAGTTQHRPHETLTGDTGAR